MLRSAIDCGAGRRLRDAILPPFHSGESRNLILAQARIFREAEWSPVGECGCRRRDSGFRRNGRGQEDFMDNVWAKQSVPNTIKTPPP